MNKMQIFEPAMCCSTGVCGVGIDNELLRVSTVLNTLNTKGVTVDRFNLTSAPQEFVNNGLVNQFLNEKGIDGLPIILVDNAIVLSGRYPSNEEFAALLEVPENSLRERPRAIRATIKKTNGCGCSGDGCC